MRASRRLGLFWVGLLFLGLALSGCTRPKVEKPRLPTGVVLITGAPVGSLLTLDEGESYPLGPSSRFQMTAGVHRLTIECDGYFPAYQTVTISPDKETSIAVKLRPYLSD